MDDFSVGSQLPVHENTLVVVASDLWLLSGVPDALTRPATAGLGFGGCRSLCGATSASGVQTFRGGVFLCPSFVPVKSMCGLGSLYCFSAQYELLLPRCSILVCCVPGEGESQV